MSATADRTSRMRPLAGSPPPCASGARPPQASRRAQRVQSLLLLAAVVALMIFLLSAGCGDLGNLPDVAVGNVPCETISFGSQVQPIFTSRCAISGCHVSPTNAGGLNLEAGNAIAQLINVPTPVYGANARRVVPGDLANSTLYQKLKNNPDFGIAMPAVSPFVPLPADQIQTIGCWIEQGAQDN